MSEEEHATKVGHQAKGVKAKLAVINALQVQTGFRNQVSDPFFFRFMMKRTNRARAAPLTLGAEMTCEASEAMMLASRLDVFSSQANGRIDIQ